MLRPPSAVDKEDAVQTALKKIIDGFREDLGRPVGLLRLLEDVAQIRATLDEPSSCISAQSVIPWHELGTPPAQDWPRRKRGELIGWRAEGGGRWQSFLVERPEYAQIGTKEITPEWSCDITDLHGFASSKSDLQCFKSTDQMVETNSREMIDQITPEKLTQNLAHREIRIIHTPGTDDHFCRYGWDGRLWLINSGGSHHTAAAKYIAARLKLPVTLTGKLLHLLIE